MFGICMSAPVCGQVKMFIHVQTLKVTEGQKRGEAFVQLTHVLGEINLAQTSLDSLSLSFI